MFQALNRGEGSFLCPFMDDAYQTEEQWALELSSVSSYLLQTAPTTPITIPAIVF